MYLIQLYCLAIGHLTFVHTELTAMICLPMPKATLLESSLTEYFLFFQAEYFETGYRKKKNALIEEGR